MIYEEKKAIKWFYNLRGSIDESNMLFDEDIEVKCGKETIEQITTVLNLIEKQEKEIEKYKILLAKGCGQILNSELKSSKKVKEDLEMLNKGWKIELEKKDKIIDLMAEMLVKVPETPSNSIVALQINTQIEEKKQRIKQYFEKKVEDK